MTTIVDVRRLKVKGLLQSFSSSIKMVHNDCHIYNMKGEVSESQ